MTTAMIMMLVLGLGAVALITRTVTDSDFPPVVWARQTVIRRRGPDSAWADLIQCGWCAGWWIAVAVTLAQYLAHPPLPPDIPVWWGAPALAATYSYLYGLIATHFHP